jgi:predicted restriction endonuclease
MNNYKTLIAQIQAVRRGSEQERPKPHKLVMLLAILDLADDGLLRQNKIYFDTPLIERFHRHFHPIARGNDWSQPALPFFHMRSSEFWLHKLKPGREAIYSTLTTSGGGSKRIHENIEYAYLSEGAFEVVSDPKLRTQLRDYLLGALPIHEQSSDIYP